MLVYQRVTYWLIFRKVKILAVGGFQTGSIMKYTKQNHEDGGDIELRHVKGIWELVPTTEDKAGEISKQFRKIRQNFLFFCSWIPTPTPPKKQYIAGLEPQKTSF